MGTRIQADGAGWFSGHWNPERLLSELDTREPTRAELDWLIRIARAADSLDCQSGWCGACEIGGFLRPPGDMAAGDPEVCMTKAMVFVVLPDLDKLFGLLSVERELADRAQRRRTEPNR